MKFDNVWQIVAFMPEYILNFILFHFVKQRRLTTAAKKAIAKLHSRIVSKKVSKRQLCEYGVNPASVNFGVIAWIKTFNMLWLPLWYLTRILCINWIILTRMKKMAYQTIPVQFVWRNTNLVKHFVPFLASMDYLFSKVFIVLTNNI